MKKLFEFQQDAVNKIVDWSNAVDGDDPRLVFRSHTGTGKTLMMAESIRSLPNNVHIVISPSLGGLADQNFTNIASHLSGFNVKILDSDNIPQYLSAGDVLVIPWGKVAGKTRVATQDREDSSVFDCLRVTSDNGERGLVWVDEAHHAKNCDTEAQVFLQKVWREIGEQWPTIELTATPKSDNALDRAKELSGEHLFVKTDRDDAVEAGLITKSIYINHDTKKYPDLSENKKYLSLGMDKREELDALVLDVIAMGIQVRGGKWSDHDINFTLKHLAERGSTVENGEVAIWLSNRKKNTEELLTPDSKVKYFIFKKSIAMGFDLPRAFVFVSFANSKKAWFNIQVLGRFVRRMQNNLDVPELNAAYVYTQHDNFTSSDEELGLGSIKDITLEYVGPDITLPSFTRQPVEFDDSDVLAVFSLASNSKHLSDIDWDTLMSQEVVESKRSDIVVSGDDISNGDQVDIIKDSTVLYQDMDEFLRNLSRRPSDIKYALQKLSKSSPNYSAGKFPRVFAYDHVRVAVAAFVNEVDEAQTISSEVVVTTWSPPREIPASSSDSARVATENYLYLDESGRGRTDESLSGPEQDFFDDAPSMGFTRYMKLNDKWGVSVSLPEDADGNNTKPDVLAEHGGVWMLLEIKDDSKTHGTGSPENRIKAKALIDYSKQTDVPAVQIYFSKKSKVWMAATTEDVRVDIPLDTFVNHYDLSI
jgi:hypothetical protein